MKINYRYSSLGGGICSECGALVIDVNLHTKFHEKLEKQEIVDEVTIHPTNNCGILCCARTD